MNLFLNKFLDPGRVNTCNDSEFWCNMISDYECKHDLARDKCPATCSQCNGKHESQCILSSIRIKKLCNLNNVKIV